MTEQSTAVATKPNIGMVNPEETKSWAEVFFRSGLFSSEGSPEVQIAQAQVKILAGAEMGLQPFFAMQNLYTVKRRVTAGAIAIGALINRPDPDGVQRTKYVIKESKADKAVIEFYRRSGANDAWELAHTQTYTWDEVPEARRANPTYQTDRPDMIFNRCLTKGGRKIFPEKVGGMRTPDEVQEQEADWTEAKESLIPEDVQAAKQTPEIAAHEATPVAATNESERKVPETVNDPELADPPQKSKSKSKTKTKAEKDEPVKADPETGEITEESTGEPEFTPEASQAADMEAEPVTQDQYDDLKWWAQGEKLPIRALLEAKGMAVPPAMSKANQAQYAVLKDARERYIKALAEMNGWGLDENLALNEQQRAWIKSHEADAKEIALNA